MGQPFRRGAFTLARLHAPRRDRNPMDTVDTVDIVEKGSFLVEKPGFHPQCPL